MTHLDAEIGVIGLGAMGSMALWRLAQRGVSVIGFEQFVPGNDRGSSSGHTRMFRTANFEAPELTAMARRAQSLWRELEDSSGEELLTLSGAIMIGPERSRLVSGTRAAVAVAGSPALEQFSRGELMDRYPLFTAIPRDHVGLWDPDAGVVRPESGIAAAIDLAIEHGAESITGTRIDAIEETSSAIVVVTGERTYRFAQVVIAAGAWLPSFAPGLGLQAMRSPMTWYAPRDPATDTGIDVLPAFIRQADEERTMWGHGAIDGLPAKIGAPNVATNFTPVDPDTVDRDVSGHDLEYGSAVIAELFADLDPEPVDARICMVTESPDGQFVLGRAPGSSRILLAGGCSGHAFKHAPAIGELLAQIAQSEEPYLDPAFVSPSRPALS